MDSRNRKISFTKTARNITADNILSKKNINSGSSFKNWILQLTGGNKNKMSIILCLLAVVLFIIFIVLLINRCVPVNNVKEELSEFEKPKEFPANVEIDKNVKADNINAVLQNCREGKENYDSYLAGQLSAVNECQNSQTVETFGQFKPEDDELQGLKIMVDNFVSTYKCPFRLAMIDLNTKSGISCNIDNPTPSASTIKLPFVASLLSEASGIFNKEQDRLEKILKWSDNTSYEKMRKQYGVGALQNWATSLNITDNMCKDEYPESITVRDMIKIWLKAFYFLNTFEHSSQMADMMADSKFSVIYETLGEDFDVSSKPGWWDGPGTTSTGKHYEGIWADCGIVYAGENPYIVIFYTEQDKQNDDMKEIISKVHSLHDSIYVKTIVCNDEEEFAKAKEEQKQIMIQAKLAADAENADQSNQDNSEREN